LGLIVARVEKSLPATAAPVAIRADLKIGHYRQ